MKVLWIHNQYLFTIQFIAIIKVKILYHVKLVSTVESMVLYWLLLGCEWLINYHLYSDGPITLFLYRLILQ